jgi:cytochrome c oxidase subunit 2
MPIVIDVVTPERFAQWIASKGGTMPGATQAAAAAGATPAPTPAVAATGTPPEAQPIPTTSTAASGAATNE